MTDEKNKRFIECGDDRFAIIKRAREHIINATNIESSPEEMQVLDNFLFRCWQMGWLKNDFHQLEKENEQLKATYKKQRNKRINQLQKGNAELKDKLKKEQNLNKVIKERLVEVNCDCNAEKKEKCVMFPEYCEGEKKTVVDLMALVSDGLNESLIKQKEEQIEQLSQRILEQQKTIGSLTDTIDEMKAHCKAVDDVNEKNEMLWKL